MAEFDGEILKGVVLEPIPKIFEGRPKPDFEGVVREGDDGRQEKREELVWNFEET